MDLGNIKSSGPTTGLSETLVGENRTDIRVFKAIGGMICALAFVAVTAAAADTRPVSALKAMAEADVRALLSDVAIGPECCDRSEEFYRDGSYVFLGFGPDDGTYTIVGNLVCVRTWREPSDDCRYVYADADGLAYSAYQNQVDAELITPRPISPIRIARQAARMKTQSR